MSEDVLLETRGPVGLVTLNRPQALNALNLGMCRAMDPQLRAWADDDRVRAVVIRGAGGRAFCAGGDVRAVAASLSGPATVGSEPLSRAFFRAEYALNHLIHHYPKPFIALVDGVCMGGGLGLSAHGAFRVVTERLMLSMPETAIGLFPDVGGGWFLPRFPGEMGTYLGLTGARCDAADARWLGYATHQIAASRLEDVLAALVDADWQGAAMDVVARVLAGSAADSGVSPLRARVEDIARCFSADRVEDILRALEAERSEWAEQTRATLMRMCPMSLKVTLRQLRMGRGGDYDAMVPVEYRLSQALTARADFREGIRAVLVDKDQKPRWSPASLDAVSEDAVDACFAQNPSDSFAPAAVR
ncbi:enoyl-CoA hydratase/isomerase family protein [Corallococcus sp. H22C18031201]|uniref:enoyl-CoA hydratase/isomerase family protein n=1 Tax=Citreicoccus inhibens TaxID=2849499 RepID=UPI000E728CB3|nr:enoyl-CoA hydratase/isomerase family protein [Citreicoccus inhibens]MBU8898198.1 enoyl-CoA hydratase/isomerase family protein [Citreicoccus inhibens]RJS26934.1 enoyl-CoA hydratase/isomerase family protein [Corallococcus sp. H22C18031201]